MLPKAPPVYKPGSNSALAAPPVYRPHQTSSASLQPKSSVHFRLETRSAPPVYRPGPHNASPPSLSTTAMGRPVQRAAATQQNGISQHIETRAAPPVFRPLMSVQPQKAMPSVHTSPQVTLRADRKNSRAIQPKFVPDEAFNSSADRKNAFALLNAAIDAMPDSKVARLRNSDLVVVKFTAGKMTTSRAHSSIDVPHPEKSRSGTFTPLDTVAQYYNLKGLTEMDITIDASKESGRAYYLQARTFAHELTAHIAPYIDILEKIKRGEGMSEEDQRFVTAGGSSGGRREHAGIVAGANQDYDELVRRMALKLSATDALDMAEDYLLDISRFDPKSGIGLKQEEKEQFIRQFNEAKGKIEWVKELYSDSSAVRALIARRQKKGVLTAKNIAIFIVLAALVIFVIQRMLS